MVREIDPERSRRAAAFAMGNPVAFDARAEERDTRGFTSIR